MNRKMLFVLAGLMLITGAAPVLAKNMHGKAAFGIQRTLLEAQGIAFSYWATPKLCVDLILGAGFVNGDVEAYKEDPDTKELVPYDKKVSSTSLLGALGFKYVVYGTKFANLSVGFKADFGWASSLGNLQQDGTWESRDDVTQFGFELPIEIEYFLSDSVSINLATGATFTWIPENLAEELVMLRSSGLGEAVTARHRSVSVGGCSIFSHIGVRFYF